MCWSRTWQVHVSFAQVRLTFFSMKINILTFFPPMKDLASTVGLTFLSDTWCTTAPLSMTMLLFPSDTAIDSYEVLSRRRTVDHLSIDGLVVGALWNGGHGKRGCGMVGGGGRSGTVRRLHFITQHDLRV